MPVLGSLLDLDRCPHCNVDQPNLGLIHSPSIETRNYLGGAVRYWGIYKCHRCGGLVTAASIVQDGEVFEIYPPAASEVDSSIPSPARDYLKQAMDSLNAPAGALMLAASAVDAMMKAKGYKEANLYSRINQAAESHLITKEMAEWAHQVRLDANEPRHADEEKPLPSSDDAKRSVEFAKALAQFMFVFPARVDKGLKEAKKPPKK